ncbi:G-protein coupled receptor [Plakobranchus ocellatus]|uniref:G-protein coupled receptor n=1 Tax=Plakobranchus ocellatus TaxID=259542 RepID=A0AAV3ZVW1_9GAST|nr:G-protein coupled receptor [Plakobranchus ocellatus]
MPYFGSRRHWSSLLFLTSCIADDSSGFKVLVTFVQSQSALETIQDVIVVRNARSEWKLTKNLFIVWLAFFLSWLPMNFLFFIDPKGELNEQVYTVAVWLMLSNSCVNPIIYGVQNRNFRQGYLKVFEKVSRRFRKSRVSPGTSLNRNGSTRSDRNQRTESTSTRSRVRPDLLQLPQRTGPHGREGPSRDLSEQH